MREAGADRAWGSCGVFGGWRWSLLSVVEFSSGGASDPSKACSWGLVDISACGGTFLETGVVDMTAAGTDGEPASFRGRPSPSEKKVPLPQSTTGRPVQLKTREVAWFG